MSEWMPAVVQVIATAGAVLCVVLPLSVSTRNKATRTEQNTDIIRNETRNAHSPDRPMRHDLDTILERTKEIPELKKDINGLRVDIRNLYSGQTDLWDTVAGTQPSHRRQRP